MFFTANPIICNDSLSCPTDTFVTEILNLLRPHTEPSHNTDPFVILNHFFGTYRALQNLLHLLNNDIHSLTLSTIHVNDFFQLPILLETHTFSVSV